jgi:hypothetical protein
MIKRTPRLRPRPRDGASGGSSSLHFLRPPVHQYLGIQGRDTERPEVAHMVSRIVDAATDRAELVARRLPQEGHGRDHTIAINATIRAYSRPSRPSLPGRGYAGRSTRR